MPNIPTGIGRREQVTNERVFNRIAMNSAGSRERRIAQGLQLGRQALGVVQNIASVMENVSYNEAQVSLMEAQQGLADELRSVDLTDPEALKDYQTRGEQALNDAAGDGMFANSPRIKALRAQHMLAFQKNTTAATVDAVAARSLQALNGVKNHLSQSARENPAALNVQLDEWNASLESDVGLSAEARKKIAADGTSDIVLSAAHGAIKSRQFDEFQQIQQRYADILEPEMMGKLNAALESEQNQQKREFSAWQTGNYQTLSSLIKLNPHTVATEDLQAAQDAGKITFKQFADLTVQQRAATQDFAKLNESIGRGVDMVEGRMPFDPADTQAQEDIDNAYRQVTRDMKPADSMAMAIRFAESGVMPESAANSVRNALYSNDPDRLRLAVQFYDSAKAHVPMSRWPKFSEDERLKLSVVRRSEQSGVPLEQALAEFNEMVTRPESERQLASSRFDSLYDDEAAAKMLEDASDPGLWSGLKALATSISTGTEMDPLSKAVVGRVPYRVYNRFFGDQVDLETTPPLEMQADLQASAKLWYERTGDMNLAMREAMSDVHSQWRLSQQGQRVVWMKNAPEALLANGRDFEWFYNQRDRDLMEAGVAEEDLSGYVLVSDSRTPLDKTWAVVKAPEYEKALGFVPRGLWQSESLASGAMEPLFDKKTGEPVRISVEYTETPEYQQELADNAKEEKEREEQMQRAREIRELRGTVSQAEEFPALVPGMRPFSTLPGLRSPFDVPGN